METRKLNILMRYPINWSVYTVMNNFIQNFYDAVGPEKFATGFKMAALVAYEHFIKLRDSDKEEEREFFPGKTAEEMFFGDGD